MTESLFLPYIVTCPWRVHFFRVNENRVKFAVLCSLHLGNGYDYHDDDEHVMKYSVN